jgi:mannose-6-phosphate isomerase-like protein (cupin superfamily)
VVRFKLPRKGVPELDEFAVKQLGAVTDAVAPDGSEVRILLGLRGGGMAHFRLLPGETSVAVRHRTVEEIWYFVEGQGEMWLRGEAGREAIVDVHPGKCLTLPVGTQFQFRSFGLQPLAAVGVTMPPWPGDGEAIRCQGPWQPTVPSGPGLAES